MEILLKVLSHFAPAVACYCFSEVRASSFDFVMYTDGGK